MFKSFTVCFLYIGNKKCGEGFRALFHTIKS